MGWQQPSPDYGGKQLFATNMKEMNFIRPGVTNLKETTSYKTSLRQPTGEATEKALPPIDSSITPIEQTRAQKIARQLVHLFCRALIFVLTRREITGLENIPEHGPMLVVANHISMADQYFIAVNVKQRMMYMAKEELFRHRPISLVVQAFGAFPVRRGGMSRRALEKAQAVLDNNLSLFMFPEGTRSRDAKLQRAYSGSALIALRNRVPIMPVGVTGLEHVRKGPFWYMARRHKLTVSITFGKPFYLPSTIDQPTKEQLNDMADVIMEHIARLLPSDYRGYYADRVVDGDDTPD